MNFLAHLFLSGNNPDIRVGNFIGDFVKGAQINSFDEQIKLGIRLHREIDHYTDTHQVVLKSKERLRPDFGHYSPVIADVFYDHFLAKNWSLYSDVSLKNYTSQFYEEMVDYKEVVPDRVNHMLTYMKRDNWLFNYQFIEGIHRALSGMSRRTTFESKMELAAESLSNDLEAYAKEFASFFPELQNHCSEFLKKNK